MKIEFIKRGAATRLILIFAGWSTDARYYNDCTAEGWDTAVVSDYRDLAMPPIPEQYATVYVFAYSLGVAAASLSGISAAVKVAICGCPHPVSDEYGIPKAVYAGTLDRLDERNLMKFHLRMAGDKPTFDSIKTKLPEHPDITALKEELSSIRNCSRRITGCGIKLNETVGRDARLVRPHASDCISFNRVYIAEEDRIFPKENLHRYWEGRGDTEIVNLKSFHAVDIASIIQSCLPDTKAIAEGFARASKSYHDNAVVQKEICDRICLLLSNSLSGLLSKGLSLLEIGAGSGLLTERWSQLLTPDMATYIDLTEMPEFGAAKKERYVLGDAERWLDETDERYDVILSASTIQWFADPIRFIINVRKHLNPGGFAIISTFVKGNLHELDSIRPCPLIYRSEEEYKSIDGVDVESWESVLEFLSARELMMHLRLTGVTPKKGKSGKDKKTVIPDFQKQLSELPGKLTYKPLVMIIE